MKMNVDKLEKRKCKKMNSKFQAWFFNEKAIRVQDINLVFS